MTRTTDGIETSVYIKGTNNGSCLNYNSICPDKYKKGVVMNFLHRAFLICKTWSLFHIEVERIKQLLVNNNFPMHIIDQAIKNFMNDRCLNNVITQ